jgi:flagellar hook-basal body complex protein FliE
MSVPGIEAIGFTPFVAPSVSAPQTSGAREASGEFGRLISDGIDNLEKVQDRSDSLAVKAATGDLNAIHDYTIAATEASVTTQLTVAVRNKAVEAFTEIMRMQV